ncbi:MULTISPECIES: hypothetical protein [Ralstonia]|jgi:hypothetical protein|uniref:Fatty acid desaturase domain-containing protein n=1 Tax=Ralstonia pickettii TaxID=329 RepID=A0ABN9HXK5_RALPI|nr:MULTISPECIES: hypothetical protein [Ralstonia]MCT5969195.1 hypothetical protein [Pseudomonas aeruginosa]RYO78435.1 hypothetical protein DL763_009654 [Monosporascus cannonballus]RYP59621.1 hypothetical protein DL771_010823 [Monosporascus sp. 5C6A]MBA4200793.1 hypothetical protein [Ralstonia sp.]MBA4230523.1 hypothetical protein [Ralstonia sp.]
MHHLFPTYSHWRYPALAVRVAEVARDHGPASRMTLATSRGRDCYGTWLVGSVVTLALIFLAMARSRSGWAPQAFVQAMLVMVRL